MDSKISAKIAKPYASCRSSLPRENATALGLWDYSFGALLTIAVCLAFALFWWNRFLGITNEGWHFFFAQQILRGKIPYRDFYLFVPPILPLEMAATIKLFGNHLIATQAIGLLKLCVLAIALYVWMARIFPAADAFLASAVGLILCIANRSEELNALHMTAIFYTVMAGCLSTLAVDERTTRLRFAFLGGMLAGLSFLAKQTSGIPTVVSLPILLAIATHRLYGSRKAWQIIGGFFAGCAIPIAIVGAWLAHNRALADAISDLFLRGTLSKGSPVEMLVRPVMTVAHDVFLRRQALLALFVFAAFLLLCRNRILLLGLKSDRTLRQLTVPAILVLICILAGWVLSYRADLRIPGTFVNLPAHVSALLGEFGSAALFLIFLVLFLRHRLHPQQVQFFMAAGFAATVAFMSSLSWPTSVGILVPSFTFVLAAILAGLRECSGSKTLRPLVLAACLVCVIQVGWQKFSSPFEWSGWREPDVHIAHQTVPLPELQGYYLSPQTAAFVTRVTDDIAAHSTASQPIFVYPDLPIFCVLAHRQLETLGYVHFIDVAPDFVDRADAVTLRNHPPAVIVYLIPSEEDLREGELLFRGGRPSGQRDLVSALAAIRPEYERIDRLVAPGTGKPIDVLALKNSPR